MKHRENMDRISFLIILIIFLIPFHIGCVENAEDEEPEKVELHLEEVLLDTNITDGFARGNEWTAVELEIYHHNITYIEFHLNPSSKEKIRDEFILEINPPNGTMVNYDPGNKSELQKEHVMIKCDIQEMQTEQIINQTDLESYTNEKGCGIWTASIYCIPWGAPWEEEWIYGDLFTLEVITYGYKRIEQIE